MRRYMKPKIISCLIMLSFIISSFSGYSVTYAENSTGEKGNPVTITDPVTGCTYNYVNFNGKTLVHPYQGKDAWTNDGKMFLCGVNDIDAHHGTIYLYDTENNEFIKVGSGVVSTEVCGVIGTDDCVYYSTGTALRKYDIKTKKTTVIIPADLGFYPTSLTISNDCNYIVFLSNNHNNHLWHDEDEFAIYRYNIAEAKVEHLIHTFDYSFNYGHYYINPENPDIAFFCHDGNIGEGEDEIPGYEYLYDRMWTANFATGEIKNVFKQGIREKNNKTASIILASHESWSHSGKWLYMNCYSNQAGKGQCIIRCYPDGSHREYLRGSATGDYSADHAMATSDDKYTIVDTGKYVYLLNNDTYQQTPISYSEGRYDATNKTWRGHPYHPHPCVARNQYKALWGLEHEGVVGVVWYDFTELAKTISTKGGRYAVNGAIDRVSYEGIDCESQALTYAEKDCYYAGDGKYLYFDINEGIVDGTNERVTLSFDYYDNSTNDLVLTYTAGARSEEEDPYGNDLAASENASITIKRTGTNKWIHKEIEIESGNFENINPYRTDFKVGGGNVYLANINASTLADGYAGGDGTKENPYQISNSAELRYFTNQVRETTDRVKVDSNLSGTVSKKSDSTVKVTYSPDRYHVFTDKYFELTNDIDLCNQPFMPIGNLIYNFNGHFNGNGYKISNAYIDGTTPSLFERYAFFGSTGANVEITNLGLENLTCKFKCADTKYSINIDGEEYIYSDRLMGSAGFVASYAGGTFKNCYLKDTEIRDIAARMSSRGTGGFFGIGYGTVKATESNGYNALTVKNCYVNGAVIRSHATAYGFIGQDFKPNTSSPISNTDTYRVTKTLSNCYTANVRRGYYDTLLGNNVGSYEGAMYPFTLSGSNVTNNCYTTSIGEKTVKEADGTYTTATLADNKIETTDVATVNAGLVDNINYYSDVQGINDGYPILVDMSESEAWNGVADKKPVGKGTKEEPYLISNKEELVWFKNSVNIVSDEGYENGYKDETSSYFKLISDIDLEGNEWEPIGNTKKAFDGHFDGNGHVIRNFKITTRTINYETAYPTADATEKSTYYTDKRYEYVGFFGRTGNNSVVENLGVEDAKIIIYNADYYYQFETDENGVITEAGDKSIRTRHPGGMVGYANGKFINCYIKNSEVKNMRRAISDSGVGGFVGYANSTASFVGCYAKNMELCSSFYNFICGFAAVGRKDTVFVDCYVADVVEERKYATNADKETTAYGFVRAANGAKVTNTFSTLADFAATTAGSGSYNSAYSYGTVSKDGDLVTKEEIINGVTQNGNLVSDEFDMNGGYPVCEWENAPFKNYSFTATKDGISAMNFIDGGIIDTVSFYKLRSLSDCYMYTVLYDKADQNRMIACSIDLIDGALDLKSTHTIELSSPIEIPNSETDRYMLKLIFVSGEESFAPICDNFVYSK